MVPFIQVSSRLQNLTFIQLEYLHIAVFCPQFTTCRRISPIVACRAINRSRTYTTYFFPKIFTHNAVGHKFRKGFARQAVPDSYISWATEELHLGQRNWAMTYNVPSQPLTSVPAALGLAHQPLSLSSLHCMLLHAGFSMWTW